ncbi:MAG: hypothetical protein N3E37_05825 [Candidatus Micrarchaeota archaeon]|nr:hypothetical protein [Candidatus Micrarchaeota archaeon]
MQKPAAQTTLTILTRTGLDKFSKEAEKLVRVCGSYVSCSARF